MGGGPVHVDVTRDDDAGVVVARGGAHATDSLRGADGSVRLAQHTVAIAVGLRRDGVAVVVDRVVGELLRRGRHGRVASVAVLRHDKPVSVEIIVQRRGITVIVDAVVGTLVRLGKHERIVVVAVDVYGEPVDIGIHGAGGGLRGVRLGVRGAGQKE